MTSTDTKVSCIAFGFTLGFGYLTAWDAWKMTAKHRKPLRSMFIWMVWGELVVNLAIAIIAWLFLEGIIKPTFPTFFFILCLWVIEIQFILQIIVNRVAIITLRDSKVEYIRWGIFAIITMIQISVFCIWIPAHLAVSKTYIDVNNIWDKITKVIILFVDCGLNYYFIIQIKRRLVRNGLQKYNHLVRFNTRIIIVSIGMDLLIIGTMFLKNGVVFMQFHPVAYTVKLKIELSMTNLITKIAQETVQNRLATPSNPKSADMELASPDAKRSAANMNAFAAPTETKGGIDMASRVHSKSGVSTFVTGDVEAIRSDAPKPKDNRIHTKREVRMSVLYANGQGSERTSAQGSRENVGGYDAAEEDDQKPLAW
ncbi:hypothetical protein K432DRAFT_358577 [Lepidopterella palustris CBS 459.81]|uniref:Transmembrane protein n=1 Tax=Lepidopterella palustris CBS 459.81 TaxID=1314670 RepID=A0A8E2JCG9_9PEZI|nr:hypothetical protein K432DRAFT_358577 [Lepidopterella palustris CBS 459.81]